MQVYMVHKYSEIIWIIAKIRSLPLLISLGQSDRIMNMACPCLCGDNQLCDPEIV